MRYSIIQCPFALHVKEMSKKELRAYFRWFMEMIPIRTNVLAEAVFRTPGYESWKPDFNPDSLGPLGDWFFAHVETRPRTKEEIQRIQGRLRFPVPISDWDLTDQTFSLAIDIGMYLGQVFLHNDSSLRWGQVFGGKRFIDYGQPVIVEFVFGPCNPVRLMKVLASSFADRSETGGGLREIYDIWSSKVGSNKATRGFHVETQKIEP